jgi:hypothetical protein
VRLVEGNQIGVAGVYNELDAHQSWFYAGAVGSTLLPVIIIAFLNIHLLVFHIWLNYKGITTYEYIM